MLTTMNRATNERIQMLDQRQKFNKANKTHTIKCLVLVMAIIFNIRFWPYENPNCYYRATWLNKVFLWAVVVPELVVRTVGLCFWNSTRYLD